MKTMLFPKLRTDKLKIDIITFLVCRSLTCKYCSLCLRHTGRLCPLPRDAQIGKTHGYPTLLQTPGTAKGYEGHGAEECPTALKMFSYIPLSCVLQFSPHWSLCHWTRVRQTLLMSEIGIIAMSAVVYIHDSFLPRLEIQAFLAEIYFTKPAINNEAVRLGNHKQ